MDIFGDHWKDHAKTMAEHWDKLVGSNDIVLCPGDLSWAMRLNEAGKDLAWIGERPGRKILGKGNHDFWWNSISKVRAALPESCEALQNDAIDIGKYIIAGSRCWVAPGGYEYEAHDEKIYNREVLRLKLSLEKAKALADKTPTKPIIAMIHYPPFTKKGDETEISRLLEEFEVVKCVYGHLHGKSAHATAFEGVRNGIEYKLIACDHIDFRPVIIAE